MKTTASNSLVQRSGFTLIEMIGVLAIMAIMAAVITPNALRSIELSAIRSEVDTLHSIGGQVQQYLRDTGAEPTSANWNTLLANANYLALSPTDLLYNRRQSQTSGITRLYIPDPTTTNHRAMLFSSMRGGVALPTAATISANFSTIWNTTEGTVPVAPGWGAWTANNVDFLVIERVFLLSSYRPDLQAEAATLHDMGEQIKLYLRDRRVELPTANWNLNLAAYSSLSPADLLSNRRQMTRVYVTDPVNQRAMLLSSMRAGLALPTAANISANFTTIWNTPTGSVPVAAGWGSWNASNIEYLTVERINLRQVYLTDLLGLQINLTALPAASYRVVRSDGSTAIQGRVFPASFNVNPNDRLNLYRDTNWTILDSSYVLSSRGGSFDFKGATWAQTP